jgi:hypothetical protein
MPEVIVGKGAAARVRKLRRYVVKVAYSKPKGFFVSVKHGKRARSGRTVHLGSVAATQASGPIQVRLKAGKLAVRLLPKPKPTLYSKVIELAASQIGVKESPPDSNNVKYNTWYYGHPVAGANFAWCAVFVSWVLTQVGHSFKQAYVPTVVELAKNHKVGLSVISFSQVAATIKAGYVVLACYDWPNESPGVADHIGFVRDVVDGANFHAIEGNTSGSSNGSQSNGGEVCLKLRPVSDVQAFVKVA